MAELPKAGMRMCLTAGITAIELPEEERWLSVPEEEQELDEAIAEVTIVARDLEEGIWTVWDHSTMTLKLINFDENGNWSWLDVPEHIINDQS